MQEVSAAWKAAMRENIVPLSYVELNYKITDPEAERDMTATDNGHYMYSEVATVVDGEDKEYSPYVTLEHNMWVLDGSMDMAPLDSEYSYGYVSDYLSQGTGAFTVDRKITLTFSEVHTASIPGLTITWSTSYDQYPNDYRVIAYNGNTVVGSARDTANNSVVSYLEHEFSNYNKLVIEVLIWSTPGSRARLQDVMLGAYKDFAKGDLINFEHSMSVDPLSLALPKAEIKWEMGNVNGEWNPDNPQGIYKYLVERQEVIARYGYKIGNSIEWIPCGTFYMSEWDTPQNGITASFTARDMLEFMGDPFTALSAGTYTAKQIIQAALTQSNLPVNRDGTPKYQLDNALNTVTLKIPASDFDYTCAEVVQLAANAARCRVYQNREGVLIVEQLEIITSGDFWTVNATSDSYGRASGVMDAAVFAQIETDVYAGRGDYYITVNGNTEQGRFYDYGGIFELQTASYYMTIIQGTINSWELDYFTPDTAITLSLNRELVEPTDYAINTFVSYENAEYDISKEIYSVNVNKGMGISLNALKGVEQTIDNPLIYTAAVANNVAEWVKVYLQNRKMISGSFRSDPRLDALDVVGVQNKYASFFAVITDVKYTYNGAFNGEYEGRVVP